MPWLTDPWFEASFLYEIDANKSFRFGLKVLAGAQGIWMWCPCGYGKPEYPLDGSRPHALMVPFANPVGAPNVPDGFGPWSNSLQKRCRWTVAGGTDLTNLVLTPSIATGDPVCWHGFIGQNGPPGEVVTV